MLIIIPTCELKERHFQKIYQNKLWDKALVNYEKFFDTLDRSLRDVLRDENDNKIMQHFYGVPILLDKDFLKSPLSFLLVKRQKT